MMDRQEIQKLLGGYATGTLTPQEQEALFAAALDDQELFDALAREQALRDVLSDPSARAQLLASIDDRRAPWYHRWWRPAMIAGLAAACLIGFGVYVNRPAPPRMAQPPVPLVAEVRPPELPPIPKDAVPQSAAPAPEPKAKSENAPSRRQAVAPAAAPVPPPAPAAPVPGAAVEPAKDLERALLDKKSADQAQVSAQSGAVALNEAELKQAAGRGGEGARDAVSSTKPISLQNAQALFYASPGSANQAAAPAAQSFAPQQEQQQQQPEKAKKEIQQQKVAQSLNALSGMMAGKVASAPLGVKWTVLRQRDNGSFEEASADQLQAGDSVKLHLLPNANGYVTVWSDATVLVPATQVRQYMPFDTPVIAPGRAARMLVTVQLTRSAPSPQNLIQNAAEQQSATDSREHATYVLNTTGASAAAPVNVPIVLTFK